MKQLQTSVAWKRLRTTARSAACEHDALMTFSVSSLQGTMLRHCASKPVEHYSTKYRLVFDAGKAPKGNEHDDCLVLRNMRHLSFKDIHLIAYPTKPQAGGPGFINQIQ